PEALTANSGPSPAGANTIVPLGDHVPPRPFGASHTVSTPPPKRTFLSFPSPKNPIDRLSLDQKGLEPFSVPGIGLAASVSSGRDQSSTLPDESAPTKTSVRPSGESAHSAASPLKLAPPGSATESRTTEDAWRVSTGHRTAANATMSAAIA